MEFSSDQKHMLKAVFNRCDLDHSEGLNLEELKLFLSEVEIDESFAEAMLLIIVTKQEIERKDEMLQQQSTDLTNQQSTETQNPEQTDQPINEIHFDDLFSLFELLFSGKMREFYSLLYKAIDIDHDGKLNIGDLQKFGKMLGEEISEDEAERIVNSCGSQEGTLAFDDFWLWFNRAHYLSEDDDEPTGINHAHTV